MSDNKAQLLLWKIQAEKTVLCSCQLIFLLYFQDHIHTFNKFPFFFFFFLLNNDTSFNSWCAAKYITEANFYSEKLFTGA